MPRQINSFIQYLKIMPKEGRQVKIIKTHKKIVSDIIVRNQKN